MSGDTFFTQLLQKKFLIRCLPFLNHVNRIFTGLVKHSECHA